MKACDTFEKILLHRLPVDGRKQANGFDGSCDQRGHSGQRVRPHAVEKRFHVRLDFPEERAHVDPVRPAGPDRHARPAELGIDHLLEIVFFSTVWTEDCRNASWPAAKG